MGKGFVLCAVVCSALALVFYAGLYEWLGISTAAAVLLLLGLCLLFHGVAIYMLKSSIKSEGLPVESNTVKEKECTPSSSSGEKPKLAASKKFAA